MTPFDIAKLRDEKADRPEAANARVKALRQLFNWACDPEYDLAKTNPAIGVKYRKSNNLDGFKAWTEEDASQFENYFPVGTKPRLAFDLLLYTGVRRSDVVRLGPQMERDTPDGEVLIFTEMKGRAQQTKDHQMPIDPRLRISIDAAPSGHMAYLVTEAGKPFTVNGFGNWFKDQIRKAGVHAELSAHGLRKLSAERSTLAGSTDRELMARYGWTTAKQVSLYARKADKAKLERRAAERLNPGQIVPLSKRLKSGGTKSPK